MLSAQEQSELEFVLSSNTHGTLENLMMKELNNDDSASAKVRYALNRVFPSGDYLKKEHPIVYRHRILYPFWLICRPFKGVVILFSNKTL